MATRGRTGLLAAAWLITAIGAGLLGALLLRPAPEIRFVDRPESRGAPAESVTPAGATGSAGSPAGAARPGAGPTATGDEDPPARAPVSSSWIEVSVRGADGQPLADEPWLEAYALPAGARGVDDLASVPNAAFPSAGKGRIPIAVPGRYDVGVVGEGVSAFATDVVVEEGETVRVDLAAERREPATFRIEGPVPEGPDLFVKVSIVAAGESPIRSYPGRGEFPPGDRIDQWSPGAPAIVHLPRERDFAFSVSVSEKQPNEGERGPRVQLVPSTAILQPWHGIVRAGDTVTLRFAAAAGIHFRIRTEPPVPVGAVLSIDATLVQGRDSRALNFAAGAADGRERSEFETEWIGVPGPATLRWRAAKGGPGHPAVGFPPGGPIEVVLQEGKAVEVAVELRIDAGPALEALAAGPVRILPRLPGGAPPPAEGVSMFTFGRHDDPGTVDEWAQWEDRAEDGGFDLDAEQRSEWTHFVVAAAGLVSAPRPLPDGGTVEVELLPAG